MGNRAAKDTLFDALASVAKALGNGRRAEIIEVLAQGERPVDDIASEIGQSLANTSHHLRSLAGAGVLRSRRDGTRILYSLASDDVAALWAAIRSLAARHVAEVDRLADDYLGPRADLEPIGRDDLIDRLARGDVVVIDVRPRAEYDAGHVLGARSIPIDELQSRLDSVPPDQPVVAYCRGPYCVYADDAVRVLAESGRVALRLEDGFPEWQRAGLPVEITEEGPG